MTLLSLFRALFILCILLPIAVSAEDGAIPSSHDLFFLIPTSCQGKFKDKGPTTEELKRVLSGHRAWYDDHDETGNRKANDPRQANLCMALLNGLDLRGANLWSANLSGAELKGANLQGANLIGADLRRARLDGANLKGAQLIRADLSGAWLDGSNLSGANLHGANMNDAVFEPQELPPPETFGLAENLQNLEYNFSPSALTRMRKDLRDSGLSKAERAVTYAIKTRETVNQLVASRDRTVTDIIEGIFKLVFFDFTTQWGMAPGRALRILVFFIPIFAIPYVIVLRCPGTGGIWRKWSDDRIRADRGTKEAERLNLGWGKAIAYGLYFSVLSAFNIGWRDLNVGNWIQRLQANEYALKATGWVRSVSGVQALISVYLLAIWALTYFGRPFE